MYQVDEHLWLSIAEMYLEGPADLWYQSIQNELQNTTWTTFCQLLHDHFDRDQHELLLRKLFNVHQTSTVPAYVTKFCELKDQLTAYSQHSDPMYFTMCFIDGLKPEIKAIVLVQRPKTLDSACSLALLQVEVPGPAVAQHPRGGDWYIVYKPNPTARRPLPLPPPPP